MIRRLMERLFQRPRTQVDVTKVNAEIEMKYVDRQLRGIEAELKAIQRRQ